jgi:DUF4097 and DUF4098 domain-containing protein YvlB
MRKLLLCILTVTFIASLSWAADSGRHRGWGHGMSINTRNDVNSDACADHISIYDDDHDSVARGEESKILPNQPLRITAAHNGGIHLRTWDKKDISVKLCKVAAADSANKADQIIKETTLRINGTDISVDGPENWSRDANWSALLLIYAPAGAKLDLSAHNGGISLYRVDGEIRAETVNGGISLKESKGKLDVTAQNGGISVKDCGGDVRVDVQNGGVSIALADNWVGTGLDAHTQNGGLSVAVPASFKSSLEVESRGYSSLRCRGAICSNATKDWDDRNKYIRIGSKDSNAAVIRASTVNGGVVVTDRNGRDDDDD